MPDQVSSKSGFKFERFGDGKDDVAIFTVCGRTRLNVVDSSTIKQCAEGILKLATDEEIRCAVLQGEPEKSFIGGADLRELQGLESHNAAQFVGAIHALCAAIRYFPVPVIARIQGPCLGGGLEIAAACDFRYCDSSAVFGMPEVRIGVPSVVEAALLPQLIGWGKTREMVYRGNIIDADEAYRIGLVEQHVGERDIDDAIGFAISDILEAAPNAIRLQKELCRKWEQLDINDAIEAGMATFAEAYETDEPRAYCQRFFDRKNSN